jgi:hypothetical protein
MQVVPLQQLQSSGPRQSRISPIGQQPHPNGGSHDTWNPDGHDRAVVSGVAASGAEGSEVEVAGRAARAASAGLAAEVSSPVIGEVVHAANATPLTIVSINIRLFIAFFIVEPFL